MMINMCGNIKSKPRFMRGVDLCHAFLLREKVTFILNFLGVEEMRKKFLMLVFTLVMLMSFVPVVSYAEVEDSGMFGADGNNLTWTYDDAGVLTISGTGQMENMYTDIPWDEYRSEINKIIIQNGVTNIGEMAFSNMSMLEIVTIPDSVTEIGDYAFSDCGSLAAAALPVNLKKIGYGAFRYCAITGEVNIPANVAEIGEEAFSGCRITAFNVTDQNTSYMSDSGVLYNAEKTTLIAYPQEKEGAYEIPEGVTKINNNVFYGCNKLTTLTIPASVTDISDYVESYSNAFSYCGCGSYVVSPSNTTLSSENGVLFSKDKTRLIAYPGKRDGEYTIPDGVTLIGRTAFAGNHNLTSIVIPGEVLDIEVFAFDKCKGLKSVTLQDGVRDIDIGAFKACGSLKEIIIPGSMTFISYAAFAECTGLDSVTILRGKKELVIEVGSFKGCSALRSVTIPGSVSMIMPGAFAECYNLSEIILDDDFTCVDRDIFVDSAYYKDNENWSNGVLYIGKHLIEARPSEISGKYSVKSGTTTISAGAFKNCKELSSVTIPSSIIQISDGLFDGCDVISDIYYEGTQAQWESAVIFDSFDGITIHYLADEPIEPIEAQIGVTDNGDSRMFTVSAANPRPYSHVYIAVYDANGAVTNVGTAELNMDGDTIIELAKNNTDASAKAFLWDSIMRPLCDAVPVDF